MLPSANAALGDDCYTCPMSDTRAQLTISPIVLGTNTFGWTADRASSFALLDHFVERGGTCVDCADSYPQWAEGCQGGESEAILGQWLAKPTNRDRVSVATKVGLMRGANNLAPDTIRTQLEASRQRLNCDVIDLYYAHKDDPNTPLRETVHTFAQLQQEGLINYVGISNYSPQRIREWLDICREDNLETPAALQPHYNLVHRKDFEDERRDIAKQSHMAVLPYFGLASGFLTGKYRCVEDVAGPRASMVEPYVSDRAFFVIQRLLEVAISHAVDPASIALAWLLAQDTVSGVLASARNQRQLEQIMAAPTVTLSEDDIAVLTRASRDL